MRLTELYARAFRSTLLQIIATSEFVAESTEEWLLASLGGSADERDALRSGARDASEKIALVARSLYSSAPTETATRASRDALAPRARLRR